MFVGSAAAFLSFLITRALETESIVLISSLKLYLVGRQAVSSVPSTPSRRRASSLPLVRNDLYPCRSVSFVSYFREPNMIGAFELQEDWPAERFCSHRA